MRRYAKPIVTADSLADLHGPAAGAIMLPPHLDWSGAPEYDLDDPARLVDYYRTVLIEATKPADLHDYLDRATLFRLWPTLWLSPEIRSTWEQRFPELPRPEDTRSAA
ncbi:hypothetical protein [Catenuloplanes indicus]|uniref:Uncharacterized protein n=1 Tax=Catenuloplanes indicus TaxID=137267 RepID=A0AAE3W0A6_9ACTN|nr:hypothetical protein [Catenuloplanes indicus]MDQ0366986.1 hypothetical protein [Catenuloplanes indicus]